MTTTAAAITDRLETLDELMLRGVLRGAAKRVVRSHERGDLADALAAKDVADAALAELTARELVGRAERILYGKAARALAA